MDPHHWRRVESRTGLQQPHPFRFSSWHLGALEKSGFDLLVSHAQTDTDVAAFDRLISSGKADGFILMRTRQRDPRIEWMLENRVPFVTHGRSDLAHRHAWFDMDGQWATELAFKHLRDLGHVNCAYVASPKAYAFTADRLRGADYAVPVIHASPDEQGGFCAAETLFTGSNPPTGVVCSMDSQAVGVAHYLRVKGIQIGRDVSLIGYDDIPFASAMQPKLTTFAQSARVAGERCADMLLGQLDGTPAHELQVLERPEPRFRGSSASPQLSSTQLR